MLYGCPAPRYLDVELSVTVGDRREDEADINCSQIARLSTWTLAIASS